MSFYNNVKQKQKHNNFQLKHAKQNLLDSKL